MPDPVIGKEKEKRKLEKRKRRAAVSLMKITSLEFKIITKLKN